MRRSLICFIETRFPLFVLDLTLPSLGAKLKFNQENKINVPLQSAESLAYQNRFGLFAVTSSARNYLRANDSRLAQPAGIAYARH